MAYKVSFVVSPAKGGLGRLFSMKGRYTEGILEIRPESQDIHMYGTDVLVSGIDRQIPFEEIKAFEGKGPQIFSISLVNGDEIQFKNVDNLDSLLDEFGKYAQDATHELVRKRIDKYEDRLRRWSKDK